MNKLIQQETYKWTKVEEQSIGGINRNNKKWEVEVAGSVGHVGGKSRGDIGQDWIA